MKRRAATRTVFQIAAFLVSFIVYIVPFYFIILTSCKSRKDASRLDLTWPTESQFLENCKKVFEANDYMIVRAFSTV